MLFNNTNFELNEASKFINVCIVFQRYMMKDSEEHRQLFDLIEKMLEYDPVHRVSLIDAMKHPFFSKLTPEQKGRNSMNDDGSGRDTRSHSLSR